MKLNVQKSQSKTTYGKVNVRTSTDNQWALLDVRVTLPKKDPKNKAEAPSYETRRFKMPIAEFDKCYPRAVKSISPDYDLSISFQTPDAPADPSKRAVIEKIYQLRPYSGSFRFKIKGFAKKDGKLQMFKSSFDQSLLQTSLEFVMVGNEWAGSIYPFSRWDVVDQYNKYVPLIKITLNNGERGLDMTSTRTKIISVLEKSGVLNYECKLGETDDPEIVLGYIEECMKKSDITFTMTVTAGYPELDTLDVLEDTGFDDEETDDLADEEARAEMDNGFDED